MHQDPFGHHVKELEVRKKRVPNQVVLCIPFLSKVQKEIHPHWLKRIFNNLTSSQLRHLYK